MATYLLTYDAGSIASMHTQLVGFVKENKHIKQWVHPYAGLFLLRSDTDVWALAKSFQEFFTEYHSHMLLPVTPGVTQGIMPKYVWDWVNQPDQSALGLSGFLQTLGGLPPPTKS